jgi:type IV secretion system protein TrbI
MSDTLKDQSTSTEPPQIKNKAAKPPGVLPKNIQAWVIIGIATLMVIVLALTGTRTPKNDTARAVPMAPSIADPNEARIQEYRNRIEENARKLAGEQERLRHAQASLGFGPAASLPNSEAAEPTSAGHPTATYHEADEPEKTTIEKDKERREYESLFASNIALTYRQNENAGKDANSVAGGSGQPMVILPQNPYSSYPARLPALPVPSAAQAAGQAQPVAPAEDDRSKEIPPDAARNDQGDDYKKISQAMGKTYRIFEGTVLEAVLTNRLNGAFSGPVNCMTTTNVYSHDGRHLLIPKGSRVLGEASRVDHFGQERLAVVFHRIIMPDGYSLRLDRFRGLNQIGETGLKDKVNRHYARIFGVSLAIGALAGLAQRNTRYGIDVSAGDVYRQETARSVADSSMRILERFLNVLPTVTIREGHRIKIYLSGDLLVPAYTNHRMPSNL